MHIDYTHTHINCATAIDLIVTVNCYNAILSNRLDSDLTKSIPAVRFIRHVFLENVKIHLSKLFGSLSFFFFNFSYVALRTVTTRAATATGRFVVEGRRKDSASLRAGRVQCRCNYGRVEGDVRRCALTSFDRVNGPSDPSIWIL